MGRVSLCLPLLTIGLTLSGAGLTQDQGFEAANPRSEFQLAYAAARIGIAFPGADSPALQNYILYPYLEAARLGRSDADAAIEEFLTRHDGEPVAENLRTAWLNSLARRELWQSFLEQYRDATADTALRCQSFAARIALNDHSGIAPLITDVWLTPFQLPMVCEPVFQWLRETGPLDDAMTEARVRLLLENGQSDFARIIARRLPDERAEPLLLWADLIDQPHIVLEDYLLARTRAIDPALLLEGWSRLARDRPEAALGLYDLLVATEGFDREAASPYALALALGLAWDRHPKALEYFAEISPNERDDYALEWQTRAALWARDWDLVRSSIAAMSEEQRDSSQWRYWAARATADRDTRERLYTSILPDDNFFAALAAAQLRERPEPHPAKTAVDHATLAELAAMPAIMRATELRQVNLPVAAAREWRFAAATFDQQQRTQSVHLAIGLNWFDVAVATATDLGIFYDYLLLYPKPYLDEVKAAADEFDLEPSLVFAVIRQESLYRPDAESSSGARGLMQLKPGTAEAVARSLGDRVSGNLNLLDPAVNIRLGAAELARLLERYDANPVPALAAYNAGPAAVDRWLAAAALPGDIWLENIPYNETREYVRRVLWHTIVFEWLENDNVNARNWLRSIEPKSEPDE